jgi:hypothetical protein
MQLISIMAGITVIIALFDGPIAIFSSMGNNGKLLHRSQALVMLVLVIASGLIEHGH